MVTTDIRSISKHKIADAKNLPFSATLYSKFKYGSKDVARKFGRELGNHVISTGYFTNMTILGEPKQIVVVPSPYYFIPTATFALKDYFIATINPYITRTCGLEPVQESKVWRRPAYVMDYGHMSLAERKQAIGSEQFYLDKEFLRGKHVIFMDDIKITGAHEERMLEMIERMGLRDLCPMDFLYFAELTCKTDPKLEGQLNLAAINSLVDLDRIIKNESFIFNTRNVKYILNSPPDECKTFFRYQRKVFLETLYHNALGNGYHLASDFEANFKALETMVI